MRRVSERKLHIWRTTNLCNAVIYNANKNEIVYKIINCSDTIPDDTLLIIEANRELIERIMTRYLLLIEEYSLYDTLNFLIKFIENEFGMTYKMNYPIDIESSNSLLIPVSDKL